MQKKIVALAIAGLASSAAFAQTNITIYGIADAAYLYQHTNGGTANNVGEGHGRDYSGIASGGLAGTRIGFKGTEDLGNGLSALFVLEQGYNIDNGTSSSSTNAFHRQAFVGLSGKAGTLTLGRQYAPGYSNSVKYDALIGSSALSALQINQKFTGTSIVASDPARWNNSVNYQSPNFGGFEAQLIYRFGEQANEIEINSGYGLGLKYNGGPLSVAYVFHHIESSPSGGGSTVTLPTGTVAGSTGTQDEHFVGVTFDAKVLTITATAQVSDLGNRQFAGYGNNSEVYSLGAIVPIGNSKIHVAYSRADLTGSSRAGSAKGMQDSATLAYTYALSKRTTLYTGINYTDKQSGTGAIATNATTTAYTLGTAFTGVQTTSFAAGINHAF